MSGTQNGKLNRAWQYLLPLVIFAGLVWFMWQGLYWAVHCLIWLLQAVNFQVSLCSVGVKHQLVKL